MAHGECFARQNTAGDNATEQFMLFHRRQQETNGIIISRQLFQFCVAMYVIDLAAVFRHPIVQECLQNSNCHFAVLLIQDQFLFLSAVDAGYTETIGAAQGLQILQQFIGIHLEQNAVDGFKDLGIIMNIFQFYQSEACRVSA